MKSNSLYLWLLWLLAGVAHGQNSTAVTDTVATNIVTEVESYTFRSDTQHVEWRAFNENTLERLRNNPDFRYPSQIQQEEESILQRLLGRLLDWFIGVLSDEEGNVLVKWSIYLICTAIIIYAVIKISGIDMARLFFKRSAQQSVRTQWGQEEIHGRDFDAEIKDAVARKDFQEAVRLHYLQVLKYMSDRELIQWKIDKTNYEYSKELKNAGVKRAFTKLTYIFESAYYGHFTVTEENYRQIAPDFSQFIKLI